MNMPNRHSLKGTIGLAVIVIVCLAVALWAGGFPGFHSRYY